MLRDKPKNKVASVSFFPFLLSLGLLIAFVLGFKDSILDANNIPSGSMIPTLKIGDYLFINKMRYSLRIPFLGKKIFHIDDPQRGDIITFLPPNEERKHYVKRVMGIPEDRIRIREVGGCQIQKHMAQLGKKVEGNASYSCNQNSKRWLNSKEEPILSTIEYRVKDKGPWKQYYLEEISEQKTHKELLDADNSDILPEKYSGQNKNIRYSQPIVYREKVGQSIHMIVESSKSVDTDLLCPEIYTEGCVIPKDNYFVMGDNRDYSMDSRLIGFIPRNNIYGKAVIVYFSINWRDDICHSYWYNFQSGNTNAGYPLENFTENEQKEYCSSDDFLLQEQIANLPLSPKLVYDYIVHTVRHRIPRMSVRWKRIGSILQ